MLVSDKINTKVYSHGSELAYKWLGRSSCEIGGSILLYRRKFKDQLVKRALTHTNQNKVQNVENIKYSAILETIKVFPKKKKVILYKIIF